MFQFKFSSSLLKPFLSLKFGYNLRYKNQKLPSEKKKVNKQLPLYNQNIIRFAKSSKFKSKNTLTKTAMFYFCIMKHFYRL